MGFGSIAAQAPGKFQNDTVISAPMAYYLQKILRKYISWDTETDARLP